MTYLKVFPGGKSSSVLCIGTLEGSELVATEHKPQEGTAPRVYRFPMRQSEFSLGGDSRSQLVLKHGSDVLYAQRSEWEDRLLQTGEAQVAALLGNLKDLDSRLKRRSAAVTLISLVCLTLAIWGLVALLNLGVDRLVKSVPVSWETTLGEHAVLDLTTDAVHDPRLEEPVKAIVERLLEARSEQPYSFVVTIIDSPEVNALAAPGGQVVVTTGFLKAAESPDEVAGVLAHEIAHVLHRHGVRSLAHRLKWTIAFSLLMGDLGTTQQLLLAQAPELLSLSFSRDMEREADREGFRLLQDAQLPTDGLEIFFERLLQTQGSSPKALKLLSTHPLTEERLDNLEELKQGTKENSDMHPLDVDWVGLKNALEERSE